MSQFSYTAERLDPGWVENLFRVRRVPKIRRSIPQWAQEARRGGPLCIMDGRPYRVVDWDFRRGEPVLAPALPPVAVASGTYGSLNNTNWADGSAVNPGGKKSVSVCAWARPASVNVFKYVVGNGGTNTNAWGLCTGTADGTKARAQNGSSTNSIEGASGTFPASAWTHIASTFDGTDGTTGLRLFTNGTSLGATTAATGTINGGAGGGGFTIGGRDAGGDAFIGEIDQVKLWYHATLADAELTQDQMASECRSYWPTCNFANLVLFFVTTPVGIARMGSQMATAPSANNPAVGTNHPPILPGGQIIM